MPLHKFGKDVKKTRRIENQVESALSSKTRTWISDARIDARIENRLEAKLEEYLKRKKIKLDDGEGKEKASDSLISSPPPPPPPPKHCIFVQLSSRQLDPETGFFVLANEKTFFEFAFTSSEQVVKFAFVTLIPGVKNLNIFLGNKILNSSQVNSAKRGDELRFRPALTVSNSAPAAAAAAVLVKEEEEEEKKKNQNKITSKSEHRKNNNNKSPAPYLYAEILLRFSKLPF